MNRVTSVLAVAAVVALALPSAAADRAEFAPAKALERPEHQFDRAEYLRGMSALRDRLSKTVVSVARERALEVNVTPAERASVADGPVAEQKKRVGLVKELEVQIELAAADAGVSRTRLHRTFGAIRENPDRTFDWSGVVRSPGAEALRVHLTGVDLAEGAELYVLTDAMAYGPYTKLGPNGTGDFWTEAVSGDQLVMQLRGEGAGLSRFTIAGLGYMTEAFGIARHLAPRGDRSASADEPPCAFNAECVVDVQCTNRDGSAVGDAKNAVAQLLFVSGAYYYLCSGGLVADSDSGTTIPYFITANHCISRAGEASSLQTFFFYRATSCESCQDPGAASTNGSTIVSTNRTSDYTLLRLSQNAPIGAAFLGWNSTAVANSNGEQLYRISHPSGSPQAYSEHVVDTSKPTCRSWPRGGWIYSRDVFGATEGGSSGSPVVNGAGQLVGQLSGSCGYNIGDDCDAASNATVDGAFANYYNTVATWLGSGGGGGGGGGGECTDADSDGHCSEATGGDDCNDSDPNIYPGHNDSKGRWGRDGVDNDCDGTIDG